MLSKALAAVRAFHIAFGQPAPDVPSPQTQEQADRRAAWIREEADELSEDTASVVYFDAPEFADVNDAYQAKVDLITVQADAYIDGIYFNLGGLVELGIDPDPLFQIVQDANMAKRHLVNGELVAVKNDQGKVIKPEGWQDPHLLLRAEIDRQIQAAANATPPSA
jgi:predicted HAD superfamily Cof-like phosphohydrolase